MVGRALWQNLKALVTCDKQIFDIENTIAEAKTIQENNQRLIEKSSKALEEKKLRIFEKKKNVALHELQAQSLKTKYEEKKERLSTISNPKEYKALEKELATLSKQCEEQEDILLKAWHDLERITKQLDEETKINAERINTLEGERKSKEELLTSLQEKLSDLLQKRVPLFSAVPADWQQRYERMKYSVQDPIVPTIQESCSACYYSILSQDMNKLKNAGVLPCRNCYRFLYYNQEEEKNGHEATF